MDERNMEGKWSIVKWANDGSGTAENEIDLVDEYDVHVIARGAARSTLKSAMAAALADPDVGRATVAESIDDRRALVALGISDDLATEIVMILDRRQAAATKSLAGYLLKWLGEK